MKLMSVRVLLLSSLAACAPNNSGNVVGQTCSAISAVTPSPSSLESPFQGTVFTIVLENKSRSQMFGGSQAPYFQSLAKKYAVADGYTDAHVHPSEPNYIWMVAGQNFGILDDDPPAAHHIASTSHLADQIEAVGKTWKAYQESMGEACKVVSDGEYAAKHNPFVFFDDIVGWQDGQPLRQQRCRDHVVDYTQFDVDLAADNLPNYVFITPNLINDMHDGSVAQGDAWLAKEVPKILASPAYQNGGVLFITADEGEGRSATDWTQADDPPFLVVSPLAKSGFVSEIPYDTSSYLKSVQAILGVEPLPCGEPGDASPLMDDLFTVPLPSMTAATPSS
ncbi:MAG TPA: alkaline phosphatase family protein [Kofleriaceae bacterium]|jgi:acid phosphatase